MNKNIVIAIMAVVIIVGIFFGLRTMKKNEVVLIPTTPTTEPSQQKEQGTATKSTAVSNNEIKVYAEADTGADRILGSSGEQMRLIVSTTFPATVTYTATYSSAVVYPGAVAKNTTDTQTVSVNLGKTVLREFTAIGGKVDIHFTYVDNSNKAASSITPPVKVSTVLRLQGFVSSPDDLLPGAPKRYDLISTSNAAATVTYTIQYTAPSTNTQPEPQTVNKTVSVPLGTSTITSITSTTDPVLNYAVK